MAKIICNTVFNAKLFSFSKKDKCATSEISALTVGSQRSFVTQVYADSFDAGFIITNDQTGNEISVYLVKTHTDADHDTVEWEFAPTSETLKQFPHLNGWKFFVLND